MPSLYITVGIPGCGKSTWIDTYLPEISVVSSDAIREELTGDITDQSRNSEVFERFHQYIEINLSHGESVAVDSTALDKFARDKLRAIADENGAKTHLILFANCDQAVVRNQARDRVVPQDVMLRMLDKFEKTKLSLEAGLEKFDTITEIRRLN